MTKEQSSADYIRSKLRDHQEYPLLDEHRRKQLITCNLYDIEQAFEDGWEQGRHLLLDDTIQYIKENINKYIINVSTEDEFKVFIGRKLWQELKKQWNNHGKRPYHHLFHLRIVRGWRMHPPQDRGVL